MIITIGGLAGSGTTTTSKILSEKIDIPYISAGDIFRQMAAERGLNILEFSKLAEKDINIDLEIDRRQAKIAQDYADIIVEGRLSAYFVESDLKICFIAPLEVRTQRISQRENKPVDLVRKEILRRGESEAKRYLEIHNIDVNNLDIYDLIINTHSFQATSVAQIILKAMKEKELR